MLSDKSRPVIQATLPVVGAHIQEIAQCFYRHLFTTHPELLNGTFNRGNQADGNQQQALAGAVAAFATALVNTCLKIFWPASRTSTRRSASSRSSTRSSMTT